MDDISTAQPALALAQKVLSRVAAANVPADLIPSAITSVVVSADGDAENSLRSAVLEFMDNVRAAERSVAISRFRAEPEVLNDAPRTEIDADEWRTHWPAGARSVEDGRSPE